jgi:peroxiredoxin
MKENIVKRRKSHSRPVTNAARRGLATKIAIALGGGVMILGAIFWATQENRATTPGQEQASQGTGQYIYQVGKPGPGEAAPPVRLAATTGETFDLASHRGKLVLMYFQEGIMCQPCWGQMKDIEANIQQFRAAGIETIVSITTDPIDALKEKAANDRLKNPVLSDPNLAVSRTYDANSYGMMGKSRNGHTFILVGPDGKIRWRADYGGAPNYTMYVPVATLMEDMRQGLQKLAAGQ